MKPKRKPIFPLGKHRVSDKQGNRKEVTITKDMALNWINKFNAMRSSGLRVTAPWEHDVNSVPVSDILNAKNNGGEWTSLFMEDDVVWGTILPATEEDEKNIGTKVNGCSIYVDDYVDGTGKSWENSILHICLTNEPVAITDNYEVNENSLSIAMSTSMKNENKGSSDYTSCLNDLTRTLKEKLGIEMPTSSDVKEYLNMLVTVFKNYKNDGEQLQAITPAMDIFMSTQEPKKTDVEYSSKEYKKIASLEEEIEQLKKRSNMMQKREKALLSHISSSTVGSVKKRIEDLKTKFSEEKNESMLTKLVDMTSRLESSEFEFDFKENSLKKLSIESEIEIIESLTSTPPASQSEVAKDQLVQVTPDQEPEDQSQGDLENNQITDIVNAF